MDGATQNRLKYTFKIDSINNIYKLHKLSQFVNNVIQLVDNVG